MSTNPSPAVNTSTLESRCQHRFANYKQCRLPASSPELPFCPQHAKNIQPIERDLSAKLLKNSQDFQTAQGINFALGNLYDLVAQNRISTRRAAVLAYINSLLLRTLPAIDADRKANIKDPTAAKSWPATEPDPTKKPS
jgi:hypothetical protein